MDTIKEIFSSEAQRSERASDERRRVADAKHDRKSQVRTLEERIARLRGELAELKNQDYNAREHPSRRAKLAAQLRYSEKMLFSLRQEGLL